MLNPKYPYIVAVTETVRVETPNEDITKDVKRGVYLFSSFKKARAFKHSINSIVSHEDIAFLFQRKETTK